LEQLYFIRSYAIICSNKEQTINLEVNYCAREECRIEDIIRIILNREKKIIYSSTDVKKAHNYLEKLDVINKLSNVSCIQYCLENYLVTIDEYILAIKSFI